MTVATLQLVIVVARSDLTKADKAGTTRVWVDQDSWHVKSTYVSPLCVAVLRFMFAYVFSAAEQLSTLRWIFLVVDAGFALDLR